jgi:hypothetical protein
MVIKRVSKKNFQKKDVEIVESDWTGSETYWTQEGAKVYTTEVGTDPENVIIRYVSTNVDSTEIYADIEFPDSDEWSAGQAEVYSRFPVITKREIHILEKPGSIPIRYRIDTYNGTTLLSQYYFFRVFDDAKVFKYGLRIRHVVDPDDFELFYNVSDDTPFEEYGIVISGELNDSITNFEDVVGKTYYFSIPTAYLPEGRALLGGANDSSARVMAFAAFLLAVLALIYVIYYTPSRVV